MSPGLGFQTVLICGCWVFFVAAAAASVWFFPRLFIVFVYDFF